MSISGGMGGGGGQDEEERLRMRRRETDERKNQKRFFEGWFYGYFCWKGSVELFLYPFIYEIELI